MPKGEHEMGPLVLVIALLIFAVGFFVGRASKQTVTSQRGGQHTEGLRPLPSDQAKETAMNGDAYPCPRCFAAVKSSDIICLVCGNNLIDNGEFGNRMKLAFSGPNDSFVPGHDFRPYKFSDGTPVPDFGPSDPLETPIFDGAFGPSDSSFTDGSFQMPPPSQGSESVTSRAGRVIPDFGPPDPLDTPIFDSAFGPSDSSFPGDGGGFQMPPVSPHDRRIEMPIFDGAFGPSDANKPQETIVKDADGKEYRLIPLK